MTDVLPAELLADGDFRLGRVISRTGAVLVRNLPIFIPISIVANLPTHVSLLKVNNDPGRVVGYLLGMVLLTLSQAILLHGAFQDMQGKRVDIGQSMRIGLRRFFPVVGLAVVVTLLGSIGIVALVVPGLLVFTNFFVAAPACVVEELRLFASMRRSAQLTEGYRWKIFGLLLLLFISDAIAEGLIDSVLDTLANGNAALAAQVIWGGVWGAFSAILAVVAYHDLRVAKEGVDTGSIAAVFA